MARRGGPRAAHRRRAGSRGTWLKAGGAIIGACVLFTAGIGFGAWVARPASAPAIAAVSPLRPLPSPQTSIAAAVIPSDIAPSVPLPHLAIAVPSSAPAEPAPPPAAVTAPPSADSGTLPAWRRFAARAEPASGRPMIAIVLDDVGIDKRRSTRAIALPAPITLAFLPYAGDLAEQTGRARANGHELLVHVPMQPHGQTSDPGPNVLDMQLGPSEVMARIDWSLKQFEGYVGVNNHMGSQFTEDPEGMRLVAEAMRERGLLFLDSFTSPKSVGAKVAGALGVPSTRRDVFLDNVDSAAEVEMRLAQVERVARETGGAVAIGHPRDATLNVLEAWIPEAKAAGFVLVPLTAVIEARRGPAIQQAQRP